MNIQFHFLQPGKSNPIVKLYIQEFNSNDKAIKQRSQLQLPAELATIDYYLVNVQWTVQSDLILFFALRSLNDSLIVHCIRSNDFTCTTLIRLPFERGSFSMSDLSSSLLQSKDSNQNDKSYYFLRFPQKNAKHGLYNHIVGLNLKVSLIFDKQILVLNINFNYFIFRTLN